MFVNAISEKDKRLLAEGEARGEARGKARGKAIGEAKGELKALTKTAKQMKADGMPVDVISKYTGLSQQDINAL